MTNDPNPARLRPFDHRSVAALPEYAAAAKALDDLVRAMNQADIDSQDTWLELVRNMTAAIPFSDCCDCNSEVYICGVVPAIVEINNSQVNAVYLCPECKRAWHCGWSITAPNYH